MKETNRISALKRLTKPISSNNSIHSRLSAPNTTPVITDARQLLTNRNKPIFDARQLLSRQSSKTRDTSLTIRNDMEDDDEEEEEEEQPNDKSKPLFITRSKDGRLTTGTVNRSAPGNIRNSQLVEPISFKKTISNAPASSDQKVVISFVNDQYRKRQRTPSPLAHSPPPIIRRLNDASIQTAHLSSSSRAPLRTNTQRKYLDDQYEPATKRISSRNTITDRDQQVSSSSSKNSLKHISTDTSVSTRPKPKLNTDEATVLITNLQTSVTEDDVIELFSQVGDIEDIKTLSHGCVQIIYAKHEQAEEAVAKYHNRLLDGKLMYVCLQQPTSYSTKSSKSTTGKDKNASSSSSNNNESFHSNSNKMAIDPAFFRQALFNPSTSTSNNVQFQVKL
ncbi:unnamed protein product [Adineta steineri]|uniref:RRM domain-containing protein n=1 Tax=Adineta steineri TaxID=433720 RepID=A0A815NUV7_9BILA|nr:unnamed protein product [Adineta steineri]CAF1574121.1 unnamed protein product [Adineta steineri]